MSQVADGDCHYVNRVMLRAQNEQQNRAIEARLAYGNATMLRLGRNARFQDCASALISQLRRMGVSAVECNSHSSRSSAWQTCATAASGALLATLLVACSSGGTVTIADSQASDLQTTDFAIAYVKRATATHDHPLDRRRQHAHIGPLGRRACHKRVERIADA